MTITLHWWYLPILLAIIPIVYISVRESGGDFDMQGDSMSVAAVCWCFAMGIVIGHVFM